MVFVKGKSGNPSGLPKDPAKIEARRMTRDVRELCRQNSRAAVETLIEVMKQKSAPPAARVNAANSLLDRGWGKPQQIIEATVDSYDRMSNEELIAYITSAAPVVEEEVYDDEDDEIVMDIEIEANKIDD